MMSLSYRGGGDCGYIHVFGLYTTNNLYAVCVNEVVKSYTRLGYG